MVLYPDNPNRIQRVQDLGNDIAGYQDEIKSQNIKQKQSNARAYETLGEIAKMKGYRSPAEYVDAAIKALPKAEREKFQKLREEITKTGKNGDTILTVTGAVATLGLVGGAILTENGLKVMSSIGSWVSGLHASATSVELSMAGATSEANEFAELGEEAFKGVEEFTLGDVAVSEGSIAAEGVEEVSTLIKVGRFASRALVVLAILATIGDLVYEGIAGGQQKDKCQKWTKELCAKRFMVYKMKDNVETAFSFMAKIYGLLDFEKSMREIAEIPDDVKEAAIQKKIKEVAEEFGKLPAPVDDTVYGSLRIKDENAHSWTNEDPPLWEMQQYLKDLADGKIKPEE
ncbi:hypothetical protein F4680DRAFT_447461 [Xylaria scruposa]|nr:hypothetical protein F4680DRAFT_447461 [Xylaria scruposa]